MINPIIERDLREQLDKLPTDQQRRVLDFARALATSRPRGSAGADLMYLAGTLDPADAQDMIRAIEDGCEVVNPDDW